MNLNPLNENILKKVYKKIHIFHNIYFKNKYLIKKKSYSMECEDLEIAKLTQNINKGFYVDAGCYHPLHLNNTCLLFNRKWNGLNIDLSEFSIDLFNFIRPNDVNINSAISNTGSEVTIYHQKKISQLTTIYKEIAKKRMQGLIKERNVKSQKLTSILNNSKYKNRKIDFLNIDLEGADMSALLSLDFEIYRPRIICVEITSKNIETSEIYNYLIKLNYKKKWSSKANINHIFVDEKI
ncbi:MAG: Methyltransferase FkbM domain-containing protein [Pelagibacterales bacterium]|jgi:hypothetical protein|nr:Methyltransferase FkbM domain-containing protein [Pelagibacterales bacterium]